jgi:hypothetical protein
MHGVQYSILVTPHAIMSCLTCSPLTVWLRLRNMQLSMSLADSLARPHARQTILLYTQVQYQRGTGGSFVEKTKISIWLASHLVRGEF